MSIDPDTIKARLVRVQENDAGRWRLATTHGPSATPAECALAGAVADLQLLWTDITALLEERKGLQLDLAAASEGAVTARQRVAALTAERDALDLGWQIHLAPLHNGYSGDGCDSGDPRDWTMAAINLRIVDMTNERDALTARVTAQEGERERHEPPCASQNLSATCVYLRDGTKVVVRRDGKKAWLEVVPQATVRATAPKDGAS